MNKFILDTQHPKPPLGLKPRRQHERDRMTDILEACLRFVNADREIPLDWFQELQDLSGAHKPQSVSTFENDFQDT